MIIVTFKEPGNKPEVIAFPTKLQALTHIALETGASVDIVKDEVQCTDVFVSEEGMWEVSHD